MKNTFNFAFIIIVSILLFQACSSDDTTEKSTQPINEQVAPIETPQEESGADLLVDGLAVINTLNTKVPYVFTHTSGAKTAILDKNEDGFFDEIALTENDIELTITINGTTGLPDKMVLNEGGVVLYHFKENNTLLDLAIIKPSQEPVYIRDVDMSTYELVAKTSQSSKSQTCQKVQQARVTMANGYRWALGGWCKVKLDNNVVFQSLNLSAQECRSIYLDLNPCCAVPVNQDLFCKQLEKQALVLSEMPDLKACVSQDNVNECIVEVLAQVDNLLENAAQLSDEIGAILLAEVNQKLIEDIDNNLGGNSDLLGTWTLLRNEEFFEGVIDVEVAGVEYCEGADNTCYTLIAQTVTYNQDGSFRIFLKETEKQNGSTNEIIEIQEGNWSYSDATGLNMVELSYEYKENGVVVDSDTYAPVSYTHLTLPTTPYV